MEKRVSTITSLTNEHFIILFFACDRNDFSDAALPGIIIIITITYLTLKTNISGRWQHYTHSI